MVEDININNPLYAQFKDAHPSWTLIGCAFPLAIIATLGIIFNFCVIYVTIHSKFAFYSFFLRFLKLEFIFLLFYLSLSFLIPFFPHVPNPSHFSFGSLNGTANYLLALYSFYELLHQSGHFLFVFTAFSGQNFIEYQTAALITGIPMFGVGGISISMFFTGFDRLFCVLFSKIHSTINLHIYLGMITFVCLVFCAALVYELYLTVLQLNGLMITGGLLDIIDGPLGAFFVASNLYTYIVTSVVYVMIGIIIKIKTGFSALSPAHSNTSPPLSRRILRSLFAIIAINMGGYFLITVYVTFFRPTIASPVTAWILQVILSIPLNISAASNGPILYLTSTEYRQAFQSTFPFFFKHLQRKPKMTQQLCQRATFNALNQQQNKAVLPHLANARAK